MKTIIETLKRFCRRNKTKFTPNPLGYTSWHSPTQADLDRTKPRRANRWRVKT